MKYFTPDALKFLAELKRNNNKPWFDANKSRYERVLRDPFVVFLRDLEPHLKKLSKHWVVDARPNGGSLSRIYRDTRFAKDKSPYKTGLFAHFHHAKGKEGAVPGLYLHVEPKRVFVGGGLWQPENAAIQKVRARIDAQQAAWKTVTRGKKLGSRCAMVGESLKRPPPGYDASHPLIEDLKRKDFALAIDLDDKVIASDGLMREVTKAFASVTPLMKFLGASLDLEL